MIVTVEVSQDCLGWTPDLPQLQAWIAALGSQDDKAQVNFQFVGEQQARRLNSDYRGKDYATNVLAFPAQLPASVREHLDEQPLGDVVICPEVVKMESAQQGKDELAHWAHLCLHGTLHLLGFDHIDDDSARIMEAREIKALQTLGLPNPYLVG